MNREQFIEELREAWANHDELSFSELIQLVFDADIPFMNDRDFIHMLKISTKNY